MWSGPRLPSFRFDKVFPKPGKYIIINSFSLSFSRSFAFILSLSFFLTAYIQKSLEILNCDKNRYKYRGEIIAANITKFSVLFFLFIPYLEMRKKCRKRFSDSRKWFKRLCWLTEGAGRNFIRNHGLPSFSFSALTVRRKRLLQLANGKIVVFFFFLFFLSSLILTFNRAHPHSWISYNFFSGFSFFSWFSLKFNESYPVSICTKGRRNYPMCRCNAREILSGYAFNC